ncbi:PCI domain-containing protein [Hirsutella rhossiliensis]|uniref:PCI domain-containing protein n=1 Tax=Hirsutella rhossiliensis TaxID=111463 RepID=A0A9P8SEC0_9HYPO|nr:PCI domain-containing protein [Hirsutella rhossiliensis]KAH0957876.1 PCI domain-containing protein [Hirsutella rhossiliensis]
MEQTKALDALAPFLALSKSATSPRAAADLITRATSAPNTFVFAELLQTPQIQALAQSPEFAPHLDLLHVFSYGTYQTYRAASDLPALVEAQALKLRQLSLLTLARDRANLSYDSLQGALDLSSARQLEDLVIKAVYQGLLHATLDPARQAVQVTSVAPLRDLQPGSIPNMTAALNAWSDRCTTTLADLEAQIRDIRYAAAVRAMETKTADEKLRRLMGELRDTDNSQDLPSRDGLPRRGINKRAMLETGSSAVDETMELDEPYLPEEQTKRASKRKM